MSDLLASDARNLPLPTTLDAGAEITAGTPTARLRELGDMRGAEVGIWEMTEGAARDVEADEVFVVIAGHATLRCDGDEIELRPGAVVRLHEGERTEWIVHEALRKLYFSPSA